MLHTRLPVLLLTLACGLLALATVFPAEARNPPPIPDLTNGGERDQIHDWELGPTGARGWIWGWNLETIGAVQILVTQVDAGSPADGVLEVNDVILGVGGERFSNDARVELGNAITVAETEAAGGAMEVIRWRDGQETVVTLQLQVLGSYGEGAPTGCEKTGAIIEAGLLHIASNPIRGGIHQQVNVLALLATGEEQYLPIVSQYMERYRNPNIADELQEILYSRTRGLLSWDWGYTNLLLTEYFLATGDETVLPAIEAYSSALARGQSYIGTWGHGMAWPTINDGELHGSLGGYGALNNVGLINHMSLVLAELCGVDDPDVRAAIERANGFARFYMNRGAIPYGDHPPRVFENDDNGKCSMAAVIFGLQGDTEAEAFFSRMTIASYEQREAGHTGNYFSFLWGALGANRLGPDATTAYLDELRWFYEMNRSWDGDFPYQGGAGRSGSEHKYGGWDCTGAFLLAYLTPRAELYITGRDIDPDNALTDEELEEVIEAGRGYDHWDKGQAYYGQMHVGDLIAALSSWSPAMRHRAAQAIAAQGHAEAVPVLIQMLESGDLFTQYGACQALAAFGNTGADAAPDLIAIVEDEDNDTWLRVQAVFALMPMRESAAEAVPVLLRSAAQIDDSDPRQTMQRYLAQGLFYRGGASGGPGLIGRNMEGVDRELIRQATVAVLQNPDGWTRGNIANVYNNLTFEELQPILPAIVEAVRDRAPSGIMFADGIRVNGLQLLAEHRIAEGIPLAVALPEPERWGLGNRLTGAMRALQTYRGAARDFIPQLETLVETMQNNRRPNAEQIQLVRDTIEIIRNDENPPEMRSLEDF